MNRTIATIGIGVAILALAASPALAQRYKYPPGPPYRPWDDFYTGRKRVVFGHWARRGLVVRRQCVGLDTGCVYGGTLSAWIAEEDRIVQVEGWRRPAP